MTKQPRNHSHFGGDQPLCSRGYEATTNREIAARAGCAEGLIHRYFGGKSGLLFNIVELHVAQDTATTIGRPACATLEAEIPEADGLATRPSPGRA